MFSLAIHDSLVCSREACKVCGAVCVLSAQ